MKSWLHLLTVLGMALAQAADASPNIVIVFIDDMGWGDFSCFGNKDAQTPNIDRLAAEGIRFEPGPSPARHLPTPRQRRNAANETSNADHS